MWKQLNTQLVFCQLFLESKYPVTLLKLNNAIKLTSDNIPFQSFLHSKMRIVLINYSVSTVEVLIKFIPFSLLHINITVVHTQQNQVTEIKGFRLDLSVDFCISNCQHFACSLHLTKKQEKRVNCLKKSQELEP